MWGELRELSVVVHKSCHLLVPIVSELFGDVVGPRGFAWRTASMSNEWAPGCIGQRARRHFMSNSRALADTIAVS